MATIHLVGCLSTVLPDETMEILSTFYFVPQMEVVCMHDG